MVPRPLTEYDVELYYKLLVKSRIFVGFIDKIKGR